MAARAMRREDGDAAQAVADLVRALGQPATLRDVGADRGLGLIVDFRSPGRVETAQ